MSYGMLESCLWTTYDHEDSAGYVHILNHKHGKLVPRPTKIVFIRYPAHFKGYMMYGEHSNGGMREI